MTTCDETDTDAATCALHRLIAAGAILTLPGVPLTRILIGECRLLASSCLAVFPAFGDHVSDLKSVPFDSLRLQPYGVTFYQDGAIQAFVAAIREARVEDPDDYCVAWSLWQELRPLRQDLIDDAFEQLDSRPLAARPARSLAGGL